MHPAPIPPDLQAAAPELARRFGAILAGLVLLVARAFLKHPRAALILPLCRYFVETARRFDRLTAHIAAGRRPRKSRLGRVRPPAEPGATARAPWRPTTRAWLLIDLKHEAAFFRGQLETLLADPAAAHLIAAHPAAARLFRPLGHMLGLGPCRDPGLNSCPVLALPRPKPKPATPKAPRPPRPPRAPREIDPHDRRAPWPWYIVPTKRSRA